MSFGKKLQQLRRAAYMSRADLAASMGISTKSIRSWEEDRELSSIDTATRVAEALRVPLDWLLSEDDRLRAEAE
jgi:transcriptional regulator with XRE-family HTH domain